eukprot:scaffold25502_cov129-Isochrysis_galbana.AAC.5
MYRPTHPGANSRADRARKSGAAVLRALQQVRCPISAAPSPQATALSLPGDRECQLLTPLVSGYPSCTDRPALV